MSNNVAAGTLTYPKLIRAYTDPTSIEYRAVVDKSIHEVTTNYKLLMQGGELWAWMIKGQLPPENQPIVMSIDGMIPMSMVTPLQQGHHVTAKYHPHAYTYSWEFNCRHVFRATISKYDKDIKNFTTAEHYRRAIVRDHKAFALSFGQFTQYIVMKLFTTKEKMTKFGERTLDLTCAHKTTGNAEAPIKGKSIWHEYIERFEETGESGTPAYQNRLSVEQLTGCFTEAGKYVGCCVSTGTDGTCCTKAGEKCTPYKITNHALVSTLETARKVIMAQEYQAKPAKVRIMDAVGEPRWNNLIGYITGIRKISRDICSGQQVDYCIGGGCADTSTLGPKVLPHGKNLGHCITCTSNGKTMCHCTMPITVEASDMALIMHPNDLDAMKSITGVISGNPALYDVSASGLGVGKIFTYAWCEEGKAIMIHKNAINIYYHDRSSGVANYPEMGLTNKWAEVDFNLGFFPFPCVVIKAPGGAKGLHPSEDS